MEGKSRGQVAKETAELQRTDPHMADIKREAKARHQELKRRVETGLTRDQEKNLAVMSHMSNKYPDAFYKKTVDNQGRDVLVLEQVGEGNNSNAGLFFTQDGAFQVVSRDYHSQWLIEFSVDKAVETAQKLKNDRPDINAIYPWLMGGVKFDAKSSGNSTFEIHASIGKLDLDNKEVREQLKKTLEEQQKLGETRRKELMDSEAAKRLNVILNDL